ncbi:MAG: folate family ECF transporter S component [Lachnospiraceae bacterium]|nr:folate family ECF transporter S component [Lachnospiraceae bacterium]
MKELSRSWSDSFKELKKIQTIAFCGIMCALAVVINQLTTINIGSFIRISFAELPNRIVEFLFGPAIGGIFGGILDVVKFLFNPTGPFFPGFTITSILTGLIYGGSFYHRKPTVPRVFLTVLAVRVTLVVGLNSLWLNILYGKALLAILPGRCITSLAMLPIETAMYFFILKFIDRRIKPVLR